MGFWKYLWKVPGWVLGVIGLASIPEDIGAWGIYYGYIQPHVESQTVFVLAIILLGLLIADLAYKIQFCLDKHKTKTVNIDPDSPRYAIETKSGNSTRQTFARQVDLKRTYLPGDQSISNSLQPDMTMSDAIDYVKSVLYPNSDPNVIDNQNEIPAVIGSILEKIKSGDIQTWGRRVKISFDMGSRHLEPYIDKEKFSVDDWKHRELLVLEPQIPTEETPQTRSRGREDDYIQFTGLYVNRSEIEKNWVAPESTQYEFLSNVARTAFNKHIDPDQPDYRLGFVDFHEGFNNLNNLDEDILSEIANAIAHYVDIYGVHRAGNQQTRIDTKGLGLNEGKHFFYHNGASIFSKTGGFIQGKKFPIWKHICIKQSDIEYALNSIIDYEE